MGFRATLNFQKFKVALNPIYRNFLNFAKSCVLSNVVKVPMKSKKNLCLFERLLKYRRMAFFFLKYLFSFQRYCLFYYANQISDDIILFTTKKWKILNKRYFWKFEAVFLKLGTTTVHHKRNEMTPLVLLPQQLFRLQSLSVKNFQPLK